MTGLLMVENDGKAYLAWHTIDKAPKDAGRKLRQWIQEWQGTQQQGIQISLS
jgi:hypothetical protein